MFARAIAFLTLLGASIPSIAAEPAVRCGTDVVALQRRTLRWPGPPDLWAPHDGPLELRDAFGSFPVPTVSEHFALKVGSQATISASQAQSVLAGLELAWSVEVDRMRLPVPLGADRYLVNVYIAGSGDGAPEIDFDGAYVATDSDGIAYVAIHPELLGAPDQDATLAHELFHTLQFALGAYTKESSSWYWEATAEWAAWQVNDRWLPTFVGPYLSLPQISLHHMAYPDTGAIIEFHHYGAALFPLYLTANVADWTLVRDSWSQASDEDPLLTLDTLLGARGLGKVDDILPLYHAHNAMFDYADTERIQARLTYTVKYQDGSDGIALHLTGKGTAGLVDAPAATAPWWRGYNVIQLLQPEAGTLHVALEGKPGIYGHPTRLAAVVARRDPAGITYLPVAFDASGQRGTLEVADVAGATELSLAVTAIPAFGDQDEAFPYAVRFEITPAGVGESDDGGCAMTASHDGARTLVYGLAFVLFALRRRDRPRRPTP